ncbi:hypothetical protein B0H10DRAFT_1947729 [Mycena sp. CBHHK59/15]|nr:hypothetical protein B0H10DRAFT_1947729 [Mycena sp. CBHHK59/15]
MTNDTVHPATRREPCAIRTNNGVITLDNRQQFTQPPDGGFPHTQICESIWRNMSDASHVANCAESDPKVWARPYRASVTDNLQAVSTKILAVVRKITGDQKLNIIAPIAKTKLDKRFQQILEHRYWS